MGEIFFAAFIGALYAALGFFLKGLYSRYKQLCLMKETFRQCINELSINLTRNPKETILMQPKLLEDYITLIIESSNLMKLYQEYRDYYTEWISDYYHADTVKEYDERLEGGRTKLNGLMTKVQALKIRRLYFCLNG